MLTELPNRPSGQALLTRGASSCGCKVAQHGSERLVVTCPEGEFDVPTFPGPPTLAARCTGVSDVTLCQALVRRVLLASEAPEPQASQHEAN